VQVPGGGLRPIYFFMDDDVVWSLGTA